MRGASKGIGESAHMRKIARAYVALPSSLVLAQIISRCKSIVESKLLFGFSEHVFAVFLPFRAFFFLSFFKFSNESSVRSIHLKFDHQTISNSPSSDVELSDFVNACF